MIFCRRETCRRNCIFCGTLAIDQGQKRIRGVELAEYLQQRLNLRNVAPERQKTTLEAFCSQDKKKQEGEFAIVCSREPKAGTNFASVLATRPRLLWWPAAAPVIAVTAARSSRDQRHGVRYVTGSCNTCCVWYSRATLKVIHTTPRYLGSTVVKYCWIIESHTGVLAHLPCIQVVPSSNLNTITGNSDTAFLWLPLIPPYK